jgi:hypothetical protein
MHILFHIISNGYIVFLPILLWNALFYKHLPPAYEIKSFNSNIPPLISTGEKLGRIIIFGLPVFMRLNITAPTGKIGFLTLILGIIVYFTSWLLLIFFPKSSWAKSAIGFTAPAYSIIIWLIGFAFTANSYYFKIEYSKWHYMLPSILFTGFHFSHSFFVYRREYRKHFHTQP